jgi:hypothetical protein
MAASVIDLGKIVEIAVSSCSWHPADRGRRSIPIRLDGSPPVHPPSGPSLRINAAETLARVDTRPKRSNPAANGVSVFDPKDRWALIVSASGYRRTDAKIPSA